MTAVREQIFAAVVAALAGLADEVERMPSGDMSPSGDTALHILDGGQQLDDGEAGTTRWALTVGIDGYVRATGGGAAAHAALNALYVSAVQALFAALPIAGVSDDIEEGPLSVMVAPRADARFLAFSFDLTVFYATKRGDPATIN